MPQNESLWKEQGKKVLFFMTTEEFLSMTGTVLPTHFQRKLLKEGQFVAKSC